MHFGGEYRSYIEDKSTGEQMWMEKQDQVYVLRLWVKNPDAAASVFSRQGQ